MPPEPEHVAAVLAWCSEHYPPLGTFVWLAATTGARRGELCALQWQDYDHSSGALLVERALSVVRGGLVVKGTKTSSSRRLALGPLVTAQLDAHLACQAPPSEWVFPSPSEPGQPWHPDTVTAAYRRAQEAAGVPRSRLHGLRHYAATQAIAGGAPVRTVSGRLGHRNATHTLNTYSHFVAATDEALAAELEEGVARYLPGGGK